MLPPREKPMEAGDDEEVEEVDLVDYDGKDDDGGRHDMDYDEEDDEDGFERGHGHGPGMQCASQ